MSTTAGLDYSEIPKKELATSVIRFALPAHRYLPAPDVLLIRSFKAPTANRIATLDSIIKMEFASNAAEAAQLALLDPAALIAMMDSCWPQALAIPDVRTAATYLMENASIARPLA